MTTPDDLRLRALAALRLAPETAKAASPTSCMVALFPPPELARALALPGREVPEDLHATLLFSADLAAVRWARLREELALFATRRAPLAGVLSGVLRFSPSRGSDSLDPFAVIPDVPGLAALRQDVVALCAACGLVANAEHGFSPHMTLAYLRADEPSPFSRMDTIPVGFADLWLCVDRGRERFPLGTLLSRFALPLSTDAAGNLLGADPPDGTAAWFHRTLRRDLGQLDAAKAADPDDAEERAAAAVTLLLQRMHEAALPDAEAVDRLIARYRAGRMTLAQLLHAVTAACEDAWGDRLEGARTQSQRSHVVLWGAGLLGAVAALAVVGSGAGLLPAPARDLAVRAAVHAGGQLAADGAGVGRGLAADRAAARIRDSWDGILANLRDGTISDAQAAAQMASSLHQGVWWSASELRHEQAVDEGEATHGWWERDSPKESCGDCIDRENNSPYPIGEITFMPGDGSTTCRSGCVCSWRYGTL